MLTWSLTISWVESAVSLSEIIPVQVRVDLSSRDIGVAQELLDRRQVGAPFE